MNEDLCTVFSLTSTMLRYYRKALCVLTVLTGKQCHLEIVAEVINGRSGGFWASPRRSALTIANSDYFLMNDSQQSLLLLQTFIQNYHEGNIL